MQFQFLSADDDIWQFYPFCVEDLPNEIWRAIKDFRGYFASNFGRVKSCRRRKVRILKPKVLNGYFMVGFCSDGKRVAKFLHRIIAETFIPNPENKPQVNHKNGMKNDNRVANLEWVTRSENQFHAYNTGLQGAGEYAYQAILTNEQVEWARNVYVRGSHEFGSVALAKTLGISQSALFQVLTGQSYKDAGGKIHQTGIKGYVPVAIREEIRQSYKPHDRQFGASALARKFLLHHDTVEKIIHEND